MPPSQSLRRETDTGYDEVDEYIESRRPRARRTRHDSARRERPVESWLDPGLESIIERIPEPVTPTPVRADPDAVASPAEPGPGRRTVVITGRGSERYMTPRRTYSSSLRPHERSGFRPDRLAMWAFLLGLALLLGAATSSHAAALALHTALHVH